MSSFPIRILIFGNEPERGGAEEHVLALITNLNRRILQIEFVCHPKLAAQIRHQLPRDVVITPIELRSWRDLVGAFQLYRVFRRKRIQVVHSHMFWASLFASPIAKLSGVPAVVETPHLREAWRKGWRRSYQIDRLIGKCVDRYIAVSQANAAYLVTEKKLPEAKVAVVRNGIDFARFLPSSESAKAMRDRLALKAEDLVVLVCVRL